MYIGTTSGESGRMQTRYFCGGIFGSRITSVYLYYFENEQFYSFCWSYYLSFFVSKTEITLEMKFMDDNYDF